MKEKVRLVEIQCGKLWLLPCLTSDHFSLLAGGSGGRRVVEFESRSSSSSGSGSGSGPGSGGQSFFRNSSSSSSSRTGPDGVTVGSRTSSQFQSGDQSSGSSNINRFAKFKDEDDLVYSNRVSASSLVPIAAKNPTLKNLLGLMNLKAKHVRSGNSDAKQVRKLAASTLDAILARTGASLLGTRAYAPKPLPRVKMSVS